MQFYDASAAARNFANFKAGNRNEGITNEEGRRNDREASPELGDFEHTPGFEVFS